MASDAPSQLSLLLVVFAMVAVASVGVLVHPVSPEQKETEFTMPQQEAYLITVQADTWGTRATYRSEGGEWWVGPILDDPGTATPPTDEFYSPPDTNATYERHLRDSNTALESRREHVAEHDYLESLAEREVNGTTVLLSVNRNPQSDVNSTVASTLSAVSTLAAPGYERVGTTDSGNVVLSPQNGWYEEDGDTYRITDSEGRVVVDPTNRTIITADIRFDYQGSDTFLHALLIADSTTVRITIDAESPEFEPPEWTEEAQDLDDQ